MSSRFDRRRRFWGAIALIALAPLAFAGCRGKQDAEPAPDANAVPDEANAPAPPTYSTRMEINTFTQDQITALRAGVQLMQQRAATDPTSWMYQANIHGVPGQGDNCPASTEPTQTAWATCQHGNFFFLAWHRMYVYYFERILRAAIQEATGDPQYQFALPYWNYEDPNNRVLPAAFRLPADASNSLYVAARANRCNNGSQCISAADASDDEAMSLIPFCNCPGGQSSCDGCTAGLTPDETFGGQFTPTPVHFLGQFGELESQPHNVIHNAIGGFSGWMSDPNCAAQDPIFWLHHANIDRLWQVWLNEGGGRENPLGSTAWTTQTFTFFDANGQAVTMTGCDILNMQTQLGYQYDGLQVENVVLCNQSAPAAPPAPSPAAEAPVKPTVLAASQARQFTLGDTPLKVAVPVPGAARERLSTLAESREPGKLRLVIEGLKILRHGAVYQVYLNLPQGQQPDPGSPYFVGNVALFGHAGHDVESARSFDITDEVTDLKAKGEWKGEVQLTFVRSHPEEPSPLAKATDGHVRFSKVSIVTRDR